jgi:hypothetical protein
LESGLVLVPWLNFRHFGGDFYFRDLAGADKMRLVVAKNRRARFFDSAYSLKGADLLTVPMHETTIAERNSL